MHCIPFPLASLRHWFSNSFYPMSTIFGSLLDCFHQYYFSQLKKKFSWAYFSLLPTANFCASLCSQTAQKCYALQKNLIYSLSPIVFSPIFSLTTPNKLLFNIPWNQCCQDHQRDLCFARSGLQLLVLKLLKFMTFKTDPPLIQCLWLGIQDNSLSWFFFLPQHSQLIGSLSSSKLLNFRCPEILRP